MVAGDGVESQTTMDFSKTGRTEMQRSAISFIEMIRTIHEAVEVDAVADSKSVTGFVGDHLHGLSLIHI